MQLTKVITGLIIIFFFGTAHGVEPIEPLCFSGNKTFKIVQFTDIHWGTDLPGTTMTIANMESILDTEKPDFVVLTGDIVWSKGVSDSNIRKGWTEVTAPLVKRKIRWTATLGNHDSEGTMSRTQIYNMVKSLPYNSSLPNPKGVSGEGNFCLPIETASNKTASALYFFDSHAYTDKSLPGTYDWIKPDQIKWYKQCSDQLKHTNRGKAVPSLCFFHIPLPEYKHVAEEKGTKGHIEEEVCSPELNSGLFAAMVQQGDIMGVFVGHDHGNDFAGTLNDIVLAYGRCSGSGGYGDLRLGARVIQLHQDAFQFDTWITVPGRTELHYSYPSKNPEK